MLQAEIVQHVPILRENWVFSVHGLARTTLDDTSAVPFFLMPSLGSGSTLRRSPAGVSAIATASWSLVSGGGFRMHRFWMWRSSTTQAKS